MEIIKRTVIIYTYLTFKWLKGRSRGYELFINIYIY